MNPHSEIFLATDYTRQTIIQNTVARGWYTVHTSRKKRPEKRLWFSSVLKSSSSF